MCGFCDQAVVVLRNDCPADVSVPISGGVVRMKDSEIEIEKDRERDSKLLFV